VFDSLRKKFFCGIWYAINQKFAIISEYCRTDYDSLVLNQETFLKRVRNVSRNAFRNASGTPSGTRYGKRPGTRSKRFLERVWIAFFIRLLLSSTVPSLGHIVVAGIHQHVETMIYLPGICTNFRGSGNVAYSNNGKFPTQWAPSIWIGNLPCLASLLSNRHPTR
jgi:hypothetical protein